MNDSPTTRSGVSRRTLLRSAAGAGVAASVGFAGVGAAQDGGPDYDGWFDDVGNYDGTTVDNTGQQSVEVKVGADGNGGTFAFAPPAMRVDPGTTVTFSWVSNTHNVLVEEQPSGADWQGHEPIENQGFSFEHTFDTEGIYKYYCQPHLSLGMKGAVVVGGSDGASSGEAGAGSVGGGQTETSAGGTETSGASAGGEGGAGGDHGGASLSADTGVLAMVLAGVAAFLSPIVFAILLFLNNVDDERPAEHGEVEYRPGTEH